MDEKLALEKFKNQQKQIDDHERRLDVLEKNTAILQRMDLQLKNVETDVKEIKATISDTSKEKGKKWDKLIDYLFYFIIATILGYVAIKLGIK